MVTSPIIIKPTDAKFTWVMNVPYGSTNEPVHPAAANDCPFQKRAVRGSVCNGLLCVLFERNQQQVSDNTTRSGILSSDYSIIFNSECRPRLDRLFVSSATIAHFSFR